MEIHNGGMCFLLFGHPESHAESNVHCSFKVDIEGLVEGTKREQQGRGPP